MQARHLIGPTLASAAIGAAACALFAATGYFAADSHWASRLPQWAWPFVGAFAGALPPFGLLIGKVSNARTALAVGASALFFAATFYLFSNFFLEIRAWAASLSPLRAAIYGALATGGITLFANLVIPAVAEKWK